MSLLATPIDKITFADLDSFLSEKIPEGIRLNSSQLSAERYAAML